MEKSWIIIGLACWFITLMAALAGNNMAAIFGWLVAGVLAVRMSIGISTVGNDSCSE